MQAPLPIHEPFWTFTFGNLATLVTLVILLVTFHLSNKKRIKESAVEFQQMKDDIKHLAEIPVKMEALGQRFSIVEALSAKMDVIHPIFMKALIEGKLFRHDA